MKKAVSLLISAFLLVTSCVFLSFPAAADEAVVYVKDGGTGDGSSAASPLGTFDAALKALAATGGTVKVVDAVTPVGNTEAKAEITGYYYAEPAHEQKITVTSADPANKAQLIFTSECQWYALSGPTVFENLKMVNATEAYARILARGNHITMGEGLEMYSGEALQTALDVFDSTMKGFTLHGITNVGAEYEGMLAADTKMTIKSGVYFLIQAYTRKLTEMSVHTGNAYLEFLGDFAVRQMGFSVQGSVGSTASGEAYVYWAAAVHSWHIFPGYDVLSTEPFTANLFLDGNADFLNEGDMPQTFVGAAKLKTLNIWYDPASKPAAETAEWTKATFTITQADGAVNLDTLDHYTGPAYRITPGDRTRRDESPRDEGSGDQGSGDQGPGDQSSGDQSPGDESDGDDRPRYRYGGSAAADRQGRRARLRLGDHRGRRSRRDRGDHRRREEERKSGIKFPAKSGALFSKILKGESL